MIRYADKNDFAILQQYDKHIAVSELQNSIQRKRVLVMLDQGAVIGWLRFGLFWDNIPFMNMLYLLASYRGLGNGRQLVGFWEREMRSQQYQAVMTSTQADEQAQVFYRQNGYTDCGALLLPGEPLEIIMRKSLI